MLLYYIKRYPFSLITILVIVYLSLFYRQPLEKLPTFHGIDKVAHFCMYAGLSGIAWIEFLFNHKKGTAHTKDAIIGAVICPILFGAVIEFLQAYMTTNRQGDPFDFLANISGVLVATCMAWYILRPIILKKKEMS